MSLDFPKFNSHLNRSSEHGYRFGSNLFKNTEDTENAESSSQASASSRTNKKRTSSFAKSLLFTRNAQRRRSQQSKHNYIQQPQIQQPDYSKAMTWSAIFNGVSNLTNAGANVFTQVVNAKAQTNGQKLDAGMNTLGNSAPKTTNTNTTQVDNPATNNNSSVTMQDYLNESSKLQQMETSLKALQNSRASIDTEYAMLCNEWDLLEMQKNNLSTEINNLYYKLDQIEDMPEGEEKNKKKAEIETKLEDLVVRKEQMLAKMTAKGQEVNNLAKRKPEIADAMDKNGQEIASLHGKILEQRVKVNEMEEAMRES